MTEERVPLADILEGFVEFCAKTTAKIKFWWRERPLHIRITTMLTAVLGLGLTLCSVITYFSVSAFLNPQMRHDVQERVLYEIPDLLGSNGDSSANELPRRIIIDPNSAADGGASDRMRNFGQHVATNAMGSLQNSLLIYLIITTILITIAGAALAYFISKRQLMRIKAGYEQMERFASDASHEIRTPLAVIKGQADLFQMKRSAEFKRAFEGGGNKAKITERLTGKLGATMTDADIAVSKIKNSADQMEGLINNLLLLTRSGEAAELKLEDIDLAEVIAGAIEDTGLENGGREVSVKVGDFKVKSNLQSLEHIFNNIFTNIVRYADESRSNEETSQKIASVEIIASQVAKNTQIIIADHGKGVHPAELPHLFERFYTNDASRNRQTSGTGLGLAIVQQTVQNLGGKIEAYPTAGGGLTFRIII